MLEHFVRHHDGSSCPMHERIYDFFDLTGMHGARTINDLNISRRDVNFLIMSRRHKFGCAPAAPTLCSSISVSFAVPPEATTSATHADAMRCTTGADTTPHAHKCNSKETSTDDEILIGSLNLRRFLACFAAVAAIASSRFISYTAKAHARQENAKWL